MEPIDFKIERLILKTGNTISNIRCDDLKAKDLSSAQSETILFYARHGGSSIKELAIHLSISHQAARKLVDKLKAKGYLESSISKEDRRFTNIYLTENGRLLYENLTRRGSSIGETMLNHFSDKEKEQLLSYLQSIEKNLVENNGR